MSDRLWLAKVNSWYRSKGSDYIRVPVTILLAAANSDLAHAIARRHAEDTAPIGPKWEGFEVREMVSVDLPFIISS